MVIEGMQTHRGTLQPGDAPKDALWCDVCGGWFLADGGNFACPHCYDAQAWPPVGRVMPRPRRMG